MQFKKGDTVIYSGFGVCTIKDIGMMSFCSGQPKERYIIISPCRTPVSTYYIPVKNAGEQLRYPLSEKEISDLLNEARTHSLRWIDNRQLRSDKFRAVLSKGVSAELIALLHCLYTRDRELKNQKKSLSYTDECIFLSAEKLIKEEFSFTLNIKEDKVNDYISDFFNSGA